MNQKGQVDEMLEGADIILVSGGNTLFAVDRWKLCGIDAAISRAASRGAVLCGGSAGAICWFDAGHSDRYSINASPKKIKNKK
jgi:dipeptidase E